MSYWWGPIPVCVNCVYRSVLLITRFPLFEQKILGFRFCREREIVWQLEVKVGFNKKAYLSAERLERLFARGQGQSATQAVG